jgi:hypothetical protein
MKESRYSRPLYPPFHLRLTTYQDVWNYSNQSWASFMSLSRIRTRITPECAVFALLAMEGLLIAFEWCRWFPFNKHKGWTVLIALACAAIALLLLLLWLLTSVLLQRRFQFGLRALFLVTLAVAIPCAWLAAEQQRAQRQKTAAETIANSGSEVLYDHEVPGRTSWREPGWLRDFLGKDFFSDVVQVSAGSPNEPNDAWLESLEKLESLEQLELFFVPVGDAGLRHVTGLHNLKFLELSGSDVTDAGMEHLQALTSLEVLNLAGTRITDSGLQCLSGLTSLYRLDLHDTKVTGLGLRHLKRLDVECVDLSHSKVTDEGMKEVAKTSHIRVLSIAGAKDVTDIGVGYLAALSNLEYLELFGTRASDDGIEKLRQTLPNCDIIN